MYYCPLLTLLTPQYQLPGKLNLWFRCCEVLIFGKNVENLPVVFDGYDRFVNIV